jgi:hypothetical protein
MMITQKQHLNIIVAHELKDFIEMVRLIQLTVYLTQQVPSFQSPFSYRMILKISAVINLRAPWFMKPDSNLIPCLA